MSPEELADMINNKHLGGNCYALSKEIVRTFLKAIQDGEVVDPSTFNFNVTGSSDTARIPIVILKPSYDKFLKG